MFGWSLTSHQGIWSRGHGLGVSSHRLEKPRTKPGTPNVYTPELKGSFSCIHIIFRSIQYWDLYVVLYLLLTTAEILSKSITYQNINLVFQEGSIYDKLTYNFTTYSTITSFNTAKIVNLACLYLSDSLIYKY